MQEGNKVMVIVKLEVEIHDLIGFKAEGARFVEDHTGGAVAMGKQRSLVEVASQYVTNILEPAFRESKVATVTVDEVSATGTMTFDDGEI